MDNLLRRFVTIERTLQILIVFGVLIFVGYMGITSLRQEPTITEPIISTPK